MPARRYTDRETIVVFQRQLEARLATVPGVQSTGAVSLLPLSGLLSRVPFTIEGRAIQRERVPSAQFRLVTPGYFDAMRIPIRRGRGFSERDSKDTRPVAVVSDMLVRQWFENADLLGAHLLVDDNDGPPRPIEIVGVVGDVKQVALDGNSTWDLYLPYSQIHRDTLGLATGNMFWVVRTASDSATFAPVLRREIRAVDPEIAAANIRPLDGYVSGSVGPRRFNLILLAVFGGAALILAITGIYAVVSYGVTQRAQEIGIRVALGAQRKDIL